MNPPQPWASKCCTMLVPSTLGKSMGLLRFFNQIHGTSRGVRLEKGDFLLKHENEERLSVERLATFRMVKVNLYTWNLNITSLNSKILPNLHVRVRATHKATFVGHQHPQNKVIPRVFTIQQFNSPRCCKWSPSTYIARYRHLGIKEAFPVVAALQLVNDLLR